MQYDSSSRKDKNGFSLLRWAGSKKKILRHIKDLVPPDFRTYFEPFAGSASLFFSLCPERAVLNDINRELVHFYKTLKKHPLNIHELVRTYPVSRDFYNYLRGKKIDTLSEIERAARFFFLNRHCFNGLYRTNLSGEFNVPMGSKTGRIPSEKAFLAAAKALRHAQIISSDFQDVIDQAREGDFVYLDPPYFTPAQRHRNEYGNGCFTSKDLPRLYESLDGLSKRNVRFVLSYSDDPIFAENCSDFRIHRIHVRRCISRLPSHRSHAAELIVSN